MSVKSTAIAAASPATAAAAHHGVDAPAHVTSVTEATMTIQSLQVDPVGLAPLAAATMPATSDRGTAVRSSTRRRFIGSGPTRPVGRVPSPGPP